MCRAVLFQKLALAAALMFSLSGCYGPPHRPAPVINLGLHSDSATGAIMVRAHDDLWDIARRYRLPLRGIIDLNNLQPPYALHAGMRLKLPAPVDYRVRHGDTLYSIANMFGVSESQMVRNNDLHAPYMLYSGDVLRIPYVGEQGVEARRRLPQPHERTRHDRTGHDESRHVQSRRYSAVARDEGHRPASFVWPVRGNVISGYGAKAGGLYNDGVNIAAPRGTPVAAAASGTVVYVGHALKSYGNLILIRHGGDMMTAYAHLASIRARKEMKVRKGEIIGTVGSTGAVSTSQLHFEIRKGTKSYDPLKFL